MTTVSLPRADARTGAAPAPRRITVLGATGSIGQSTLDLVARNPAAYEVEALTARSNVARLAEQARRFKPGLAVIADGGRYRELKEALSGTGIEAAAGEAALIEAAERPSDWVMAAIVGAAGLGPTLAALRRGPVVALANKEALVCAGALVMAEVARNGATLLPVDSEHNAIFQVIDFDRLAAVQRIVLTASGGPFLRLSGRAMARVTPAQAVAHPTWRMGAKISVDSATIMNKGLELIEAHHLFGLPEERIEVLIHPQSVVHSMVAYVDGSVLAQMSTPDMRTPIAHTLAWPERMPAPVAPLDLARLGALTFEAPDPVRFPALALARAALRIGGAAPTVLNAANEAAVEAFLAARIGFLDIPRIVEEMLAEIPLRPLDSVATVLAIDRETRRRAADRIARLRPAG